MPRCASVIDRTMLLEIAITAALRAASPAIVNTDRLCDASDEWSSRRTPGTPRIAAAIASTTSGRRPSLTLGMLSMIDMGTCIIPPIL